MKRKKKLPDFSRMSRKEEAEFWDSHDATEFGDGEFEEAEVVLASNIMSPQDLSPRCPKDDKVLLTRYVDLEIADGRLILRHMSQLYCREGHFTMLPAEVEKDIRILEAVDKALREPESRVARPKKKAKRTLARITTAEKATA